MNFITTDIIVIITVIMANYDNRKCKNRGRRKEERNNERQNFRKDENIKVQ